MLKIRDDVDLQELERFGFEYRENKNCLIIQFMNGMICFKFKVVMNKYI